MSFALSETKGALHLSELVSRIKDEIMSFALSETKGALHLSEL